METGLTAFSEQLTMAGFTSVEVILRASDEELVAAGLKKLHVNKLRRAIPVPQDSTRNDPSTLDEKQQVTNHFFSFLSITNC